MRPLKSIRYRRQLLTTIKHANAGHTGGDLSCIDILNVFYNGGVNVSPETFTHPAGDRYISDVHWCRKTSQKGRKH